MNGIKQELLLWIYVEQTIQPKQKYKEINALM